MVILAGASTSRMAILGDAIPRSINTGTNFFH